MVSDSFSGFFSGSFSGSFSDSVSEADVVSLTVPSPLAPLPAHLLSNNADANADAMISVEN